MLIKVFLFIWSENVIMQESQIKINLDMRDLIDMPAALIPVS